MRWTGRRKPVSCQVKPLPIRVFDIAVKIGCGELREVTFKDSQSTTQEEFSAAEKLRLSSPPMNAPTFGVTRDPSARHKATLFEVSARL